MRASKSMPPFHVLLIAIYPVLFLLAHNIESVGLSEVAMPLVATTCSAVLLWLALSFILKDKEKGGLIVSVFLLLFFSYGHVKNMFKLMQDWRLFTYVFIVGRNKILFSVWTLLFVSCVYLIVRTHRSLYVLTSFLNVMTSFLVAITLFSIGIHELNSRMTLRSIRNKDETTTVMRRPAVLPNIYYIILDGYARGDVLKDFYGYDNAEFLGYLTKRGFYVAGQSRANYSSTGYSLASSLNLRYLNDSENGTGRVSFRVMIQNNKVMSFLRQYGYQFVAFSSGYETTEIRNADIYRHFSGLNIFRGTEFQNIMLNTTPIPDMMRRLPLKRLLPNRFQYDLHRKRILYIFDHLADMTTLEAPVFVFAHIIAPHGPYVFGPRGEAIFFDRDFSLGDNSFWGMEHLEDYLNELTFVNRKIETVVEKILSNSAEPSIIILQSDHGPAFFLCQDIDCQGIGRQDLDQPSDKSLKERLAILNAYYLPDLPDDGHEQPYEEITPVNTFRIILNRYFGTNYELLDDRSICVVQCHPAVDVTERVK